MTITGPRSTVSLADAAEAEALNLDFARQIVEAAPTVRLLRDGHVELPRLFHGEELAAWLRSTWGRFGPLGVYDMRAWSLFKALGYTIPGPGAK